ncbi:rhodanese family protein [Segnochrobactrum spirostomi]|uniref:DUF2892 domain-containing protein n=1 Tax=Segnochrobactrum spirostomi TaxID=2608987 RepID=A0A6A7XZT0_9HYPH|nr:rhodanese family protein [Segnochrobactrum spirostomi]MQT11985.1 DUF2892 domain-containing protein [Segnochrobactrum spirostomi]
MSLQPIDPAAAARLAAAGALVVDIREADEYAREHIAGARNVAVSRLAATAAPTDDRALVFHCRSGNRTNVNAVALAEWAGTRSAYVMTGGLDGWKAAGLATVRDTRRPIEIMRQVQITAGSLVLIGVVLGYLVAPDFFLLSGLIGAGLLFAGVSGWCGMAKLLALMPWNRPSPIAATPASSAR